MNVVLLRLSENGNESKCWLRDGQSITVGKSPLTELCIDDDPQLDDRHFRVEVTDGKCRLLGLTSLGRKVLVNGVHALECELHDQDLIEAGRSRFRVMIEGARGGGVAEGLAVPNPVVAETNPTLELVLESTHVARITVLHARKHLALIVDALAAGRQSFAIANFKWAKHDLPGGITSEKDLFKDAPPEIRETDSLHLLALETSNQTMPLLVELADRDAGMVMISPMAIDDLTTSHRCFWAWFARPSLLDFHLRQGSRMLTGKLLDNIHAVIMMPRDDENCVICCPLEQSAGIVAILNGLKLPQPEADAQ